MSLIYRRMGSGGSSERAMLVEGARLRRPGYVADRKALVIRRRDSALSMMPDRWWLDGTLIGTSHWCDGVRVQLAARSERSCFMSCHCSE